MWGPSPGFSLTDRFMRTTRMPRMNNDSVSSLMQLFRESLLAEDFIEVHTPKTLAGASEGGAAVFRFDYMGRPGCLAQVGPWRYLEPTCCMG